MSFCWVTINVKDMKESLEFYEKIVGLKVNQKFEAGPGIEIAFLGEGETQIELMYNKENRQIDLNQDISLGFKVDSVDEKMKFVKEEGFEIHSGPFQPSPEVKFCFVQDPNGLRIQFVEDI